MTRWVVELQNGATENITVHLHTHTSETDCTIFHRLVIFSYSHKVVALCLYCHNGATFRRADLPAHVKISNQLILFILLSYHLSPFKMFLPPATRVITTQINFYFVANNISLFSLMFFSVLMLHASSFSIMLISVLLLFFPSFLISPCKTTSSLVSVPTTHSLTPFFLLYLSELRLLFMSTTNCHTP